MTWHDKQPILARLGHAKFSGEDEYDEWFAEQDNIVQKRIRKAVCEAEEYGFDWSRRYFTIETTKTTKYVTAKSN